MNVTAWFAAEFVPDRLPGAAHAATRKTYLVQLGKFERHAAAQLGRPATVADFSDGLLKGAMAAVIAEGRTAATANKLYRHIKAVWGLAHDRGLVERRCKTKPYREERRDPEAWRPEEVDRLIDAAGRAAGKVGAVPAGVWWPALLLFELSTGVRITATMRTPLANLDLERGEVLVPAWAQKQRADQRFDLLPGAVAALRRLAPWERRLATIFGDWTKDPGGHWNTLRRGLRRLMVAAGLYASLREIPPGKHAFHKLRKTFATRIAAAGGKHVACELLGHSGLAVTERYLDPRQLERPRVTELIADVSRPTSKGRPKPAS